MGTTSSAIFTGSSQFSQDFQNSITRAVSIASLPITQMNTEVTHLQSQATALTGIDTLFTALQTAIQGIGQAIGGASFDTDISNTSAVNATVSDGAMEGTYSIDVQSIGSFATSMSTSAWASPVNAPGQKLTYQLSVGTGTPINITAADNSPTSVAAAINATAGNKVRATVVNVGSNDQPDYRISLQATTLGPIALNLSDGTTSLQTQQAPGELAQYVVNGSGNVVSSTTRSVSIANGLSLDLISSDAGQPVNVTVTRSTSALSTAMATFADAYNATIDALDAQRGQSTGALVGNSLISNLSQTLSGLATYSSGGSGVSGLSALGMELGTDGHLTFNQFSLISADLSNSSGVTAFLGSATGSGFLKLATDAMASLEDPTSGFIKNAETDIQSQINNTTARISDKQDQVTLLQQRLQDQMAAADAAISSMEQQYSYLASVFQSQQIAAQQYK